MHGMPTDSKLWSKRCMNTLLSRGLTGLPWMMPLVFLVMRERFSTNRSTSFLSRSTTASSPM